MKRKVFMFLKKVIQKLYEHVYLTLFQIFWYFVLLSELKFLLLSNIKLKNYLLQLKKNSDPNYIQQNILNYFKFFYFLCIKISICKILMLRFYGIQLRYNQVYAILALYFGLLVNVPTGEGKTLILMITSVLHALDQKKVHLITSNGYLSKRDHDEFKDFLKFLNLSQSLLNDYKGIKKFQSDIEYGTAENFVFYFLKKSINSVFFEKINYDILLLDEIDHFLIDVKNTPLIISEIIFDQKKMKNDITDNLNSQKLLSSLKDYHFKAVREKNDRSYIYFFLSSYGQVILQSYLLTKKKVLNYDFTDVFFSDLYLSIKSNLNVLKNLKKDEDYIIKQDKIEIINKYTHRIMKEHKYKSNIQTALEIKENIHSSNISNSILSMYLMDYFKKYKAISGVSGSLEMNIEMIENNFFYINCNSFSRKKKKTFSNFRFKNTFDLYKNLKKDIFFLKKKLQPTLVYLENIDSLKNFHQQCHFRNIEENVTFFDGSKENLESDILSTVGRLSQQTFTTPIIERGADIKLGLAWKKPVSSYFRHKALVHLNGGLAILISFPLKNTRLENQINGRTSRQGSLGESRNYMSFTSKNLTSDHKLRYNLKSTYNFFSFLSFKTTITPVELELKNLEENLKQKIDELIEEISSLTLKETIHLSYSIQLILKKELMWVKENVSGQIKKSKKNQKKLNHSNRLGNIQNWNKNLNRRSQLKKEFLIQYVFYPQIQKKLEKLKKNQLIQYKSKCILLYEFFFFRNTLNQLLLSEQFFYQNFFGLLKNEEDDLLQRIIIVQDSWIKTLLKCLLKITLKLNRL